MKEHKPRQTLLIEDLWLDKAMYQPGEAATLHILLHNQDTTAVPLQLHLSLCWLDEKVWEYHQHLTLPAGKDQREVPLTLPTESFRGYGLDLTVCDEHDYPYAQKSTALDVLENWTQAPRYGFLSDFAPGDQSGEASCASLARYHINIAQFYDWMWRHYILMPPAEDFHDALGRHLSLHSVRAKVAACQTRGIAAFGYAAVYAAEPEYALEHPDEMLYDAAGEPYSLEKLFYIMNIHANNPWRVRILAEIAQAVREVPFDGLHLDQYGFPRDHVFGPSPERVPYDLAEDFPVFIDEARRVIREARPDSRVIFNLVENWPLESVAPTSQDATYIEVWPPYTDYVDLQKLILGAQRLAPHKQVILAAYLSPLKGAQGEDLLLAETATRLASAAIWANGGFHLLIGEKDAALCDPYYVAYASLRPAFARVMRGYYDFVVRYENTLSDLRLVTLPAEETQQRIQINGVAASSTGEAGKVWTILRQMPQFLTVSLLNLCTAPDVAWNAPKPLPQTLRDLEVEIRVDGEVTGAYAASPDQDEGRPGQLTYNLIQRDGATWLHLNLPVLEYWSVITVKTAINDPA